MERMMIKARNEIVRICMEPEIHQYRFFFLSVFIRQPERNTDQAIKYV